jgi:hypothetical protein
MEETTTAKQHFCPICGSPMILRIILHGYKPAGRSETGVMPKESYRYWECVNIKCGSKAGES